MPIYEYACTACGKHTEVQQSFSDQPLEQCEHCSGKLRRVFHPVGVMFKGSGFYSTDAKSSSSKMANGQGTDSKSEGKAASSKEGSGSGSKETSGSSGASKSSEHKSSGDSGSSKASSGGESKAATKGGSGTGKT